MHFLKHLYGQFKAQIFTGPDSRFQLKTCLQIALAPLIAFTFTGIILWIFLNMVHIFFESNGLMVHQDLREAFFDAILEESYYIVPYMVVFTTALFFLGYYISNLLLRPFKFISDYTLKIYQSPNETFVSNTVKESKLPTSLGIKFFHYLNESRKMKKISPIVIEDQYTQIDRSIFDAPFIFYYVIFLILPCAIATWGLYLFTLDMHERIVGLSLSLLKTHSYSLIHFLKKQEETLDYVIILAGSILSLSYIFVGKMIISKVNNVSYSFFKTMRDFMQGNFNARVVLKEDDPCHNYADSFNNLLEHVIHQESNEIDWKSRRQILKKDKVA